MVPYEGAHKRQEGSRRRDSRAAPRRSLGRRGAPPRGSPRRRSPAKWPGPSKRGPWRDGAGAILPFDRRADCRGAAGGRLAPNSGLRPELKFHLSKQACLGPSDGALVYEAGLSKTEKSADVFSGAASSFLADTESATSVGAASLIFSGTSGTFVGAAVSATPISPSSPSAVR